MQILIADDDIFTRRTLEIALKKWGYEVLPVSTGHEALELLRAKGGPRLAVLDWMMPGMYGPDVVREVRKLGRNEYIYIMLLTGKGEGKDLILGLEAGADDYIVKPFEPNELRARIRCGQRIVGLHADLVEAKAHQEMVNRDLQNEIRERKRVEKLAVRAKQEWERTFDTMTDMVAIIDPDHRVVRLNKSMARKIGLHPKEAIGKLCYKMCHGTDSPPSYCPLLLMMRDRKEYTAEIFEEKLGGYFIVSVAPLYDEKEEVAGCVHVARDVTEKKALEKKLMDLASHDPLTGLPNRRHLLHSLDFLHENARRYGSPLSIGILDLDYFKEVNDEYGHRAGDQVLKSFGDIMRRELRRGDIAGRYGGDEFIIAFPHTPVSGAAESVERIRAVLEQASFRENAKSYHVSCTAGVAEFSPEHATVDDMIHEADMALYEAKKQGRNCLVVRGVRPPGSEKPGLHRACNGLSG
jgi:diguanylate cyclase (GGDEF)-like protein/PAS domain S-box-containing protein